MEDRGLKSLCADFEFISSYGKARNVKDARSVAMNSVGSLPFCIFRRDGCADNACARRIYNAAGKGGSNFLAPRGREQSEARDH